MASTAGTIERNPGAPASEGQNFRGPFSIMTILFFMWGFITVLNDILIPRLKDAFTLSHKEAMLVQSAFFGAYFIGSFFYFLISITSGDPIAKIGYKNGVVIGLMTAAIGSVLFWPAAVMLSYPLFLIALFVVGLGVTILQIAANPYVTILGPEKTASSRLNLAQGFNSLGTTLGPLIGGHLIYQYFARTGVNGAESVKIPYLTFCIIFFILAVIFFFIHLPHVGEGRIEPGAGVLKYPHVALGVLAIFMYVGGEVSVGSNIINFLRQPSIAGLEPVEASKYVSLFWGGMLIGRFMAAVELSELKKLNKQMFLIGIPILGFLLFFILFSWNGNWDNAQFKFATGWPIVLNYLPFLALCWLLFQCGQGRAGRTLMIFSLTAVILLGIAIFASGSTGKLAMWCIVGLGLFSSVGWSNTFSLAIEGVGIYKSQASSFLVMAVLGGALLPPLQGYVADAIGGSGAKANPVSLEAAHALQISFIIPMIAYAYVAFYGLKGHRIGRAAASN